MEMVRATVLKNQAKLVILSFQFGLIPFTLGVQPGQALFPLARKLRRGAEIEIGFVRTRPDRFGTSHIVLQSIII